MIGVVSEVKDIWKKRGLAFTLAKADFKKRFVGNSFGILWMFVQPLVTVAIYYMVFTLLRGDRGQAGGPPFILWMIAGMIPWFFFNEAWNVATTSLQEYSYLVKKVVFQISVLPVVKIISALFVHLIFMLILFAMYIAMGYYPTIYWLQIPYYFICMLLLIVGLAFLTSAVYVFFKDMGQIVNIGLQFGMWLTPIMWEPQMIPARFQWLIKLNPMYYIVEGYRDCLLEHQWFWQFPKQTAYFWLLTLGFFFLGITGFRRLRPHFADVL